MTASTGERLMDLGGVELCVETFGEPDADPLLLIAGAAQSLVWWEVDFCRRLAASGFRVLRYDHRDTGRSTTTPAGRPGYTSRDFFDDPRRLLDALDVGAAHVVGLSMGGAMAQLLALEHPERVRTLTLMSTTPAVAGPADRDLPPPEPRVMATFTEPAPEPDWTDRDAVIDYRVETERPFAGSLGFDETRSRELATVEVDRARDMAASLTNHFVLTGEPETTLTLDRITAPTLVVHGTTDPMFPLDHGRALAAEIPGARLIPLDGVGHQQPPRQCWDEVIGAIVELTSAA